MCEDGVPCQILGTDPAGWSKACILPPPAFLDAQMGAIESGARLAIAGQIQDAVAALRTIPSQEMRAWWRHVEQAARARAKILGHLPTKPRSALHLGVRRNRATTPAGLKSQVFQRDNYRCCYCGARVLAPSFLHALDKVVGQIDMRFVNNKGAKIEHGAVVLFAVEDHVVPDAAGGATSLENLVTSCGPCNYAKMRTDLVALGVVAPGQLARPVPLPWDGLASLVVPLKALARNPREF